MAIQFDDTSMVGIGGSSIRPRDVSQFQRGMGDNGAGDQMLQLAKSLEGLSGAFGALEQTRIAEQEAMIPYHVAQIEAGFGAQATTADINDVTSSLHPKVRQRVTEDYMSKQGFSYASAELDRRLDANALMNPEAEQAVYQQVLQEGLARYSDPLTAAGFIKGMESAMSQRRSALASSRMGEWQTIQKNGFRDDLAAEADAVASGSVVPQLSNAIASTAQKYEAPWMTGYLSRVSQIESGGGTNLVNPNSSARGPFQFINSTGKAYGLATEADRMDFNKSTDAAARLTMDNYNALSKALGREPTSGELYLAHQQGAGGAIRLLTSDASAVDVVGVDAVRLNGGKPGMSAKEFAGLWTKKFGSDTVVSAQAPSDPSTAYLPAEAQRLREYFFGKDEEYKATSSLQNNERRDVAADVFLQKAIQYRDTRFLMAMPEHLKTKAIRDAYAEAETQIENLQYADKEKARKARKDAEDDLIDQAGTAILNDRLNGIVGNPAQYAMGPDGVVNPKVLKEAVLMTSLPFVDARVSQQNAANIKDEIMSAGASGDWSKLVSRGLIYEGDNPTPNEIKSFIRMSPELGDSDKQSLMETASQDMEKGSFIQTPRVVTRWKSVDDLIAEMSRNPLHAPKFAQNTRIVPLVRQAYESYLMDYVQDNGIPQGNMGEVLSAAEEAAMKKLDTLLGIAATPAAPAQTPAAPVSAIGTTTEDSKGKKYRKIKDGPDTDINNWEEIK